MPRAAPSDVARQWRLRDDTIYLNHGSFGPPPDAVRQARLAWQAELDAQPMDFFVRRLEPALLEARAKLAKFVGADVRSLVFVENATAGMNLVAENFHLRSGDDVLLTSHEYGAVKRIWSRAVRRQGATLSEAPLPERPVSAEQVVDAIFRQVQPQTRIIVVSHITSPTALILPVDEICARARHRGIAVCIDGPHAVAQVPLDIESLACDFYCASCHKWLSAPFGSGFLYVGRGHCDRFEPLALSWGRLLPARPESWDDEFLWSGTRDPSAYLSIPAAIDFLEGFGVERFRKTTHALSREAGRRLRELLGTEALASDDWFGSMACAPLPPDLPPNISAGLQAALWTLAGIEIPVVEFNGRRHVRVSCHLYNDEAQIDKLVDAVRHLLNGPPNA